MPSLTRVRAATAAVLTAAAMAVVAPSSSGAAALSTTPSRPRSAAADGDSPAALLRANRMGPADPRNPTNPLAGRYWGVYRGNADPAWPAFVRSRGATRKALAQIALRPKAKFFGDWIPNSQIRAKMRDYIRSSVQGHPGALIQLTLFRMVPWEGEACRRLPTSAERASYRHYVDIVAQTLGRRHAAVVLQPDGPFLQCVPHGSDVPASLLRYAVRTLSAQPHVSVYVEMGSADWFRDDVSRPVPMLIDAGVAQARGFALDTSHFDSVARQIRFGAKIAKALAARGIAGKHFVIDTSDNGHAFTGEWWQRHHPGTPLGYAPPCSHRGQTHCVALGIPPTTEVASSRWGLSPTLQKLAGTYVDGYLWISRPWLDHQSGPFVLERALREIRYSPY